MVKLRMRSCFAPTRARRRPPNYPAPPAECLSRAAATHARWRVFMLSDFSQRSRSRHLLIWRPVATSSSPPGRRALLQTTSPTLQTLNLQIAGSHGLLLFSPELGELRSQLRKVRRCP